MPDAPDLAPQTPEEAAAREKVAAILGGQPRRVQKKAIKLAIKTHKGDIKRAEAERRKLTRELAAIGYADARYVPAVFAALPSSTHETVIALHHAALQDMAHAAQVARGVRPEDDPEHADLIRTFPGWPALRASCQVARLFEMPVAQYSDIWAALEPLATGPDAWPAESITFPQRWPFDVCYFAWGAGRHVTRALWANSADDDPGTEVDARIFAHLVTRDGTAATLLAVRYKGKDTLWLDLLAHAGRWFNDGDRRAPWLVHALHRMATGHGTSVIESPAVLPRSERRRLERDGYVPAPYYVVTLKNARVTTKARFLPRQFKGYSHRFDVRGHASHRIARGAIPIDPKRCRTLVKRGYRFVHALTPVDLETLDYLRRRGVPLPTEGEWLAVLTSWRDAFVKGPDGKPYVPSVRRVPAEKASP